ncbi:MAG TPA: thermonuclease family protein [Ilumatobacteraceae bacterium]|nr:thermonuclease family protein [Ilumatobacteraceae bacterium]HRB03485.1 thermonuclease family protein [Ilumatobacteraceae bacterium]
MGRWRLLGLALALGACSDGPAAAPTTTGLLTANATVIYVTDGDTIGVEIDGAQERVRLIGIDTPETKKPNTPIQCFGPEATAFTKSLLPEGTALHVERDVEARDVYGRLLAYVYRSTDGLFVNMEIIGRGYARPLTIPPNVAHADEFVAAARNAEATNVGLWAGCSG